MSKLDEAIAFAATAHADHRRKYTGMPYIVHPIEVMNIVGSVEHTDEMLMAAVLHDVIEDTPVGPLPILRRFGAVVHDLVQELTDPKSTANRATRHAATVARLASASTEAQTIKVADLISNTSTIVEFDPNFAKVYLREKSELLAVLTRADPALLKRATSAVELNYGHPLSDGT